MAFSVHLDGTIKADTLAEALEVRSALLQRAGASKGGANRWKKLSPERREKLSAGAAASARKHFAANPGKGSISVKRGKFCLMVCVEGRARWAGSWPTLTAAEDAQRQVLEARKAGLPLPPFVRPHRSKTAVENLLDEAPSDESAHAPIWADWDRAAPSIGDVGPKVPTPSTPGRGKHGGHALGPGCVEQRGKVFIVRVSVNGTQTFAGSFKTKEEAEAAQTAVYEARLRGEAIPILGTVRPCGRCRKTGHLRKDCQTPEAELPKKPLSTYDSTARSAALTAFHERKRAEDPIGWKYRALVRKYNESWVLQLRIDGRVRWGGGFGTEDEAKVARDAWLAAARAGESLPDFRKRAHRCGHCESFDHGTRACPTPRTLVAPAPKPAKPREPRAARGSVEWRVKLSASVAASWVNRRGRAPTPCPTPLASPRPQLPPRCGRCIRVGHIDAECPRAAPAAPASRFGASDEVEKPVVGLEVAIDDDGGTDLTDLVDVPDPWSPATAGAAVVTPPPLVDLPRAAFHMPVIDEPKVDPLDERYPEDVDRPRTRGDCESMPRPCPFVTCQHHLYRVAVLEAQDRSGHAGKEPWQLPQTCALDVADQGGLTLEEVGQILGVTRERIRQIEAAALDNAGRISRRKRMDFEAFADRDTGAAEDVAPYSHARGGS